MKPLDPPTPLDQNGFTSTVDMNREFPRPMLRLVFICHICRESLLAFGHSNTFGTMLDPRTMGWRYRAGKIFCHRHQASAIEHYIQMEARAS